jgi:type IV pilus assembly protein PilB
MLMGQQFKKKLRLGDLLLEYDLITQQQLEDALKIQKSTGVKLGEALINAGYVTRQNINEILEFQLGIPYVNLKEYKIDQEAIKLVNETLVRRHRLLPINLRENEIYIAMEDPLDIYAIDDISLMTGMQVIPMLASEDMINTAIEMYYGKQQAMAAAEQFKQDQQAQQQQENETILLENEDDVKNAPIVKLVNSILEQAVRFRASDIHIEPFEKHVRVRFRIDGKLKEIMKYDVTVSSAVIARIKITGGMDISEKRKPQDGRITISVDKQEYDIRVSMLPTVYGEKIVMRIASKEGLTKDKQHLGFFDDDMKRFDKILTNPHGIILVTGPTGSGKSTTLYTALSELNQEDINIITVEDPVEANINGINQVQVNQKAGLTFAAALRSILRQDPDIIMIGEIRDQETAEIAVKASITGHLVVSTLHTNSASSSITRLIDMGIEPFMIGASIVGVIAQRLVRKLCPKCKEAHSVGELDRHILGLSSEENATIYKPVGCHLCNNTGYKGRIGVYEIIVITQGMRLLINKGASADEIKEQAIKDGMFTLKSNAARLVLKGTTSIDEMIRIAYEAE